MAVKRQTKKVQNTVALDLLDDREVVKSHIGRGVVLKALKSLEATNGVLTPQDVVNDARSASSELHKLFNWNDADAGEKYRLMQARLLINQVRVEFMGERREAFLNVVAQVESVPTRGYVSIERILSDKDLHSQVLAAAIKEIEYWNQKYEKLVELKGVVNQRRVQRVRHQFLR